MKTLIAALFVFFASLTSALAVNPDEVLDDPALEARARALSAGLRCMVCQNQSIDDSNAELAKDLRLLVRERLKAGDTDTEVLNYLVSRYGEFVLLKPPVSSKTIILWSMPFMLLVFGGAFIVLQLRNRARPVTDAGLSDDEQKKLDAILKS